MTLEGGRLETRDGHLFLTFESGEPFELLSFRPPALILKRGSETKTLYVHAGREHLWVRVEGATAKIARPRKGRPGAEADATAVASGRLEAPMPGKVLDLLVAVGDEVEAGQQLAILEAMKMESPLRAPAAATVAKIYAKKGDALGAGDPVIELDLKS